MSRSIVREIGFIARIWNDITETCCNLFLVCHFLYIILCINRVSGKEYVSLLIGLYKNNCSVSHAPIRFLFI